MIIRQLNNSLEKLKMNHDSMVALIFENYFYRGERAFRGGASKIMGPRLLRRKFTDRSIHPSLRQLLLVIRVVTQRFYISPREKHCVTTLIAAT